MQSSDAPAHLNQSKDCSPLIFIRKIGVSIISTPPHIACAVTGINFCSEGTPCFQLTNVLSSGSIRFSINQPAGVSKFSGGLLEEATMVTYGTMVTGLVFGKLVQPKLVVTVSDRKNLC